MRAPCPSLYNHSSMTTHEPIRLLHFADLHIGMENYGQIDPATGINQRVVDFIRQLSTVVDYALTHGADLVLFCGDAFKTRDPSPTFQRELARRVMQLANANIPVVLLVGNHDIPIMEKRASSVDIYRTLAVPNVYIGSREELLTISTRRGPIQIGTVPWPVRSRLVKQENMRALNIEQLDRELERILDEEILRLSQKVNLELPAILAGHFTVAGATYGSERKVMIGRDAVIKTSALQHPAWDYVAMGHIHKHQVVNAGQYPEIVYSGSLERIDFGEENETKGFCWVEVARGSTKWQFIPVEARRFITIDVDATDETDTPTDSVVRAIDRTSIEDAVVRVRVKLTTAQEPLFKLRDVERALTSARFVVAVNKEILRDTRSRIGLLKAESLTPPQLLAEYLQSKDLSSERSSELLALANPIFTSAKPT